MSGEYPERPRVAVGGVVVHDSRVLLVCRNKPPSKGEWAIPGGSVELGETLEQAVAREVLEETGVAIRAGEVCHWFQDIRRDDSGRIRFHYVIIDFLGEYLEGWPKASSDVSDAGWFAGHELTGLNVNVNTTLLLKKIGFLS